MGTFKAKVIICIIILITPFLLQAKAIQISEETTYLTVNDRILSDLKPGDTLILVGRKKDQIAIKGLRGTEDFPIYILPQESLQIGNDSVHYVFSLQNCQHIILGSPHYPISLAGKNAGSALGIDQGSDYIEVRNVHVNASKGPGFLIKSDPQCDGKYSRGKFKMHKVYIHDCSFSHTGTEGIYLGSTFFSGMKLDCNPEVLYPHIIDSAIIRNNRFYATGWDAVQVASTSYALIEHNYIENASTKEAGYQMSSIIIGDGAGGLVQHNYILQGKGIGIQLFNSRPITIQQNIIIEPGLFSSDSINSIGVYYNDKFNLFSQEVLIQHNYIDTTKRFSIMLELLNSKKQSVYVINNLSSTPMQIKHEINQEGNYIGKSREALKLNLDYSPQTSSPHLNRGRITMELPELDYNFNNRVVQNPEPGPFEFQTELRDEYLPQSKLFCHKIMRPSDYTIMNQGGQVITLSEVVPKDIYIILKDNEVCKCYGFQIKP